MEKEKKPIIGFIGLLVMLFGFTFGCMGTSWAYWVAIAGGVILIYALLTGNVKFLG